MREVLPQLNGGLVVFDVHAAKNSGRGKTALKVVFFSLFLFLMMTASASAVSISVSDITSQDSGIIGDRYYQAKVTISCVSGENTNGIVELGLSKDSTVPFATIWTSSQPPCEATFPWNTHVYYGCGTFSEGSLVSSKTVTLTGRNIPDGTYYPVLTHATACFNSGGQPKEPYGYGKRITSNTFTFGNPTGNVKDQCNNPSEALQWVKAAGDVACQEAICNDAASTSSTAQCIRKSECADGAEQFTTCSAGNSLAIRGCVGGQWTATGKTCPTGTIPGEPAPTTPETVKASLGGGASFGAVLIIVGGVLISVWFFRRFFRRFR